MLKYNPHQRQVVRDLILGKQHTLLWTGSKRVGKTVGSVMALLAHMEAFYQDSDVNYIIGGYNLESTRNNILPILRWICNEANIPMTEAQGGKRCRIWGNNVLTFGASDDRSQFRVQGITGAFAFLDEMANLPEAFYQEVKGQLSMPHNKMIMTMNKKSPSHWTKAKLYDKVDELGITLLESTLEDNEQLSDEIKESLKRGKHGHFYQRHIANEWASADGVVYPFYHIVDHNQDYEDYQVIGVDYSQVHGVTYAVKAQRGVDQNFYLTAEYYYNGRETANLLTDDERAEKIINLLNIRPNDPIVVDPSAPNMMKALSDRGFRAYDAENDVELGIETTDKALREGKLLITDNVPYLLQEITVYEYNSVTDKPRKENDHAMDAMRYLAMDAVPIHQFRSYSLEGAGL